MELQVLRWDGECKYCPVGHMSHTIFPSPSIQRMSDWQPKQVIKMFPDPLGIALASSKLLIVLSVLYQIRKYHRYSVCQPSSRN